MRLTPFCIALLAWPLMAPAAVSPLSPPASPCLPKEACQADLDSDGDGVPDDRDLCPFTPVGAVVDRDGCALDSDFDGVADGLDLCPNTPLGVAVDAQGCPVEPTRLAQPSATAVPPGGQRPGVTPPAVPAVAAGARPVAPARVPRSVLTALSVGQQSRPAPVAPAVAASVPAKPPLPAPVLAQASAPTPEPAEPVRAAVAVSETAAAVAVEPPPAPAVPVVPAIPPAAPGQFRARPLTLDANTRLAEVPFAPGVRQVNAAQAQQLQAVASALRDSLAEGAAEYVELVGFSEAGRPGGAVLSERVVQVQQALLSAGIPADRVVFALRPARSGEQPGMVEVHRR